MNDINSHKHASYFANAVRDRDAPGYHEIIKQPQHLKSIRAAISAGARAVAAAEAPSQDTSIEVERSVDILPPKGIVNAAQLEKEVMRMFANAVMFNPGEDGLVGETREMAEDVEGQIRVWRGFGTESGEKDVSVAEVEESVVEEEAARSVKRRKL